MYQDQSSTELALCVFQFESSGLSVGIHFLVLHLIKEGFINQSQYSGAAEKGKTSST